MTNTVTISDFLDDHKVINLCTVGPDGPWASAVFYVFRKDRFYFLSSRKTRHCRNLAIDSRVSATIQSEVDNWRDIKGLQLEGRVMPVAPEDKEDVIALYSERFPVIGPNAPQEIAQALDKISWYELIPSLLLYIDNSKGLGHRVEIEPGSLERKTFETISV